MLTSLFQGGKRRAAVHAVYREIVERARDPVFYLAWGVPDTLDGRFEVLALHAFLVLDRLKRAPEATSAFAQDLFDTMFADLDRGLREMGASDIGVGTHVKAMARAFYGRIAAYEPGLRDDGAALPAALRRNLYGTASPSEQQIAAVAVYARRQAAALAAWPAASLLAGDLVFAPLEDQG